MRRYRFQNEKLASLQELEKKQPNRLGLKLRQRGIVGLKTGDTCCSASVSFATRVKTSFGLGRSSMQTRRLCRSTLPASPALQQKRLAWGLSKGQSLLQIKQQHEQCLLEFSALESEGPATSFVDDLASRVDQVHACRHAAVRITDGIVDLINQ